MEEGGSEFVSVAERDVFELNLSIGDPGVGRGGGFPREREDGLGCV